MENLSKHVGHMSRRLTPLLPVSTIGFVPQKKERVIKTFESFNFSFILEGSGTYTYKGECLEVSAPCVIVQWPGEPMDYGPDKSWYEVYFIYGPEAGKALEQKGFFRPGQVLWHISDPARVQKLLVELDTALRETSLNPDRIDYICEGMIMESLLAKSQAPADADERKIRQIKTYVQQHLTARHDFAELARRYGMSLTTFRRRWLEYTGIPPAKYQSQLLIREACRLLIEKNISIGEVAAMLNFEDPYYFSKKFHKETGLTPSRYRKQHLL